MKKQQYDDLKRKLKQLSGEMHPSQVFKKYFVESLTPDPVEMEIDPPTQLFNDILQGKVKITFPVGMQLGRYYDSCAQLLVDYQKRYDDLIEQRCKEVREAESKAFRKQLAASRKQLALFRRLGKQVCAELRRQHRAKPRSKKAREKERALRDRQFKQLWAKLLRQVRAKPRSKR
jgi:plasmid maintenance system antidote protein VapI